VTDAVATARRTVRMEGEAILAASERIDDALTGAVELLASSGRVIVSGIGKSGVIAQKIAATLTSTGTAASYVHPVESLHGDLGLVDSRSVAILLSKSGETDELFGLLGALVRLGVPVIAITGARDSTLGRAARFVLDASVTEEACPHDLAPTTSTAVALALGDGVAMALLERKGFGRGDFAALHPAGRLGRKLLLRVADVMVPADAMLSPTATMRDVVVGLAHGRGIVAIASAGTLAGVITAGDLTRIAERTPDYLGLRAESAMTAAPRVVHAGDLAAFALGELERYSIMAAPVLDTTEHVVGIIHLHDLLRSGAG
jgi:arabinose-5-phosphate isomerase